MNKDEAIQYMYNETLMIERAHMADLLNIKSRKLQKEVVDEILTKLDKLEIGDENK